MVRTVVVPLDGSAVAERALRPATTLARHLGAELELLRVVPGASDVEPARQRLAELASGIDVPVRPPYVIEGDWPAECIANAGDEAGTLICLSSHGAGGLREVVLGSVATDVLRLSTRPVLVVGPAAGADREVTRPVVVCVDGSTTSEAVLPAASAWVDATGAACWVVTVLEPDVALPADDVVESGYVRQVAERLGAEFEVLHGSHPDEAIVGFARSLPAGVIAMATHGRTGLARVVAGSVAMGVVRHAPCPVLLLRPADLRPDG
jgi:nucleotide-binding universal stress UspA family protein